MGHAVTVLRAAEVPSGRHLVGSLGSSGVKESTQRCGLAGLANDKVYGVKPGEEGAIVVSRSRARHQHKPSKAQHSVASKKNFRRVTASIAKEVQKVRPDLKVRRVMAVPPQMRRLRQVASHLHVRMRNAGHACAMLRALHGV